MVVAGVIRQVFMNKLDEGRNDRTEWEGKVDITGWEGMTALIEETKRGHVKDVDDILDKLTNEQVVGVVREAWNKGALIPAAQEGKVEVIKALLNKLPEEEVVEQLNVRPVDDRTLIMYAASAVDPSSVKALLEHGAQNKDGVCYTPAAAIDLKVDREDTKWAIVSVLLQYGAVPSTHTLEQMMNGGGAEIFKRGKELEKCFWDSINAAANPLIPGMNISAALARISRVGASDQTQRALVILKGKVDRLIRTVLGRLECSLSTVPDSVWHPSPLNPALAHHKKLEQIFEPEVAGLRPKQFLGPLRLGLKSKDLEFLDAPVVLGYMSHRFNKGLPKMLKGKAVENTGNILRDGGDLDNMLLEGVANLSWLPGLQYTLISLAGQSSKMYTVPAMRFTFEFISYGGALMLFISILASEQTGDSVQVVEVLFYLYAVGAALKEVEDWCDSPSTSAYLSEAWNCLDLILLLCFGTALVSRIVSWAGVGEGDREGESAWSALFLARFFLAVSAPIFFSRNLFLVQVDPLLGPFLTVIFRTFSTLAYFSGILVVVMLGFALTFYSLFRFPQYGNLDDHKFNGFRSSLLTMFEALLGDFDFEDPFVHSQHGQMGKTLLGLYLTVMTIIFLNLLIAVLSTEHSKVDCNAEKEANLSRALMIHKYSCNVEKDRIPAPFNLFQLPLRLAGDGSRDRDSSCRAVGHFFFWLVMGSLGTFAGMIFSAVSTPWTVVICCRDPSQRLSMLGRYLRKTWPQMTGVKLSRASSGWLRPLGCALGPTLLIPAFILLLWMRSIFLWLKSIFHPCTGDAPIGPRKTYKRCGDANIKDTVNTEGLLRFIDKPLSVSLENTKRGGDFKEGHPVQTSSGDLNVGGNEGNGSVVGDLVEGHRRDEVTQGAPAHVPLLLGEQETKLLMDDPATVGHLFELQGCMKDFVNELIQRMEAHKESMRAQKEGQRALEENLESLDGKLDMVVERIVRELCGAGLGGGGVNTAGAASGGTERHLEW